MDSHIHENVDNYLEIYNTLYDNLKWKVQSHMLMMVSLLYVINEKNFNLEEYMELCKYIKNNTNVFSPLHSHQRFSTSAMLITKFEDPKAKFHELIEYQNNLTAGGFKKGPYTTISSLALMTTHNKVESLDTRIDKAIDIYKGMKSNHFFLTSQGDYPLAILLSQSNSSIEVLMEEIEFYYSALAETNFKKGNDLQFLSHILMLSNIENKQFIVDRCNIIYEDMLNEGLKIKRFHYPQIGLMSIIDKNLDEEILQMKEITNIFNTSKHLKSTKDTNLTMAILLTISNVIKNLYDDITIIEAGINTTIEAIIQAQNAALISSIAATSATTASV